MVNSAFKTRASLIHLHSTTRQNLSLKTPTKYFIEKNYAGHFVALILLRMATLLPTALSKKHLNLVLVKDNEEKVTDPIQL